MLSFQGQQAYVELVKTAERREGGAMRKIKLMIYPIGNRVSWEGSGAKEYDTLGFKKDTWSLKGE